MTGANDPIRQLQSTIDTLWQKADNGPAVTVATMRSDDGSPHVEPTTTGYDIVITERGSEQQRFANLSLHEAARWYLHGMAVAHAQNAELANRTQPETPAFTPNGLKDTGYSRWNWMAPTIQTMQGISPELGQWAQDYYAAVFVNYPLEDYEIRNAKYALLPNTHTG